jgi:hypothetical protein
MSIESIAPGPLDSRRLGPVGSIRRCDLEAHLEHIFADARVAYLHVHNARPGCHSCGIDRANTAAGVKSTDQQTCAVELREVRLQRHLLTQFESSRKFFNKVNDIPSCLK